MKIFLDDDPVRDNWVDDTWTIVRTVPEVVRILESGEQVTMIDMDNDLGEGTPEGHTLATWIEGRIARWEHPFNLVGSEIPVMLVHSRNPVAEYRMRAAIISIERMRAQRMTQ